MAELRLITYDAGEGERLGAWTDAGVVDLSDVAPNMLALIEAGPQRLADARIAAKRGRPIGTTNVRLAPPILPRRNAFAVGRNYTEHIVESARGRGIEAEIPERIVFFTKPPSSLIGPDDGIEWDERVTTQLDYEVELTVVIGSAGRNIARADAAAHVFGYSIGNDISARDLQSAHLQWFKGKSLDRTSGVGPWIVPAGDVPDIADARLTLTVNGEMRQDSRTSLMVFDIPTIIEQLSLGMALQPGDLIMTGTPAGIGHRMSPPRYLRDGDDVRAHIDGLGELRNRVTSVQP
jgi:2-keto-4-pentenoate hydratase/2-oxohepta-3-ene-1,7-dioic acid hydratase in catechol pathway